MYSYRPASLVSPPDYRQLDAGIRKMVEVLVSNGIETIQSCEGGKGHSYPEPTVEFCGGPEAGFRALAVAMTHGLKVAELRRVWSMQQGEPVGPHWAMTFYGVKR